MERKIGTFYICSLLQLPKIGRKTARKILDTLSFSISSHQDFIAFVREQALQLRLPEYTDAAFATAFADAEKIQGDSERFNIRMVDYLDEKYPAMLKATDDYPIILNYKGNLNSLRQKPNVAIIGTREPSEFGFKTGIRLSEIFSTAGFNIVSGLATGCDTAGHIGALQTNGTTTAVLAHGLDTVYPKENRQLAEDILEKDGLLVSEYFVRQRAMSNFFVERDRIQAGLSESVIVIETDVKGGSMHTVKFCENYRRQLACLDHPSKHLNYPKTKGNQLLLREHRAFGIGEKEDIDVLMYVLLNKFAEKLQQKITETISESYYQQILQDLFARLITDIDAHKIKPEGRNQTQVYDTFWTLVSKQREATQVQPENKFTVAEPLAKYKTGKSIQRKLWEE